MLTATHFTAAARTPPSTRFPITRTIRSLQTQVIRWRQWQSETLCRASPSEDPFASTNGDDPFKDQDPFANQEASAELDPFAQGDAGHTETAEAFAATMVR